MNEIVPIKDLAARANYFAKRSVSPATKRAYESDWVQFQSFCETYELEELPATPETVCLYLTHMAESRSTVATIVRRCTSITAIHRASGHDTPIKSEKVSRVLKGIKNSCGAPAVQSKALSWKEVKRLVSQCGSSMLGKRDAAIIALGWASALRRSELVYLNIGDLSFVDEGLIITIRRSKTDQEGHGQTIGIPRASDGICPVSEVKGWIERRSKKQLPDDAPLFTKIGVKNRGKWWCHTEKRLTARMISEVVKVHVKHIGLNPDNYSAHSLRRGLATEAGAQGVPERIISRHTRHQSMKVLRNYIEAGTIWTENPLHAIYSSSSGN